MAAEGPETAVDATTVPPRDGRATSVRAPGDPEALWFRFRGELRRFVARCVHRSDVDDILQSIYLRIHNALTRPVEIAHPRGWLFQVARSALSDHIRAAQAFSRAAALAQDEAALCGAESGGEPDEHDEGEVERELCRCLLSLIRALPEEYREALEWTELDGMTQHEAAVRAGISLSGMKSRVQRGRDRLRSALLDCCEVHLDGRRRPIDYNPKSKCTCAAKWDRPPAEMEGP